MPVLYLQIFYKYMKMSTRGKTHCLNTALCQMKSDTYHEESCNYTNYKNYKNLSRINNDYCSNCYAEI